MYIKKEAYIQEFTRREMVQGLEAKRLARSGQKSRPQGRFNLSRKLGRPFQALQERIQVLSGAVLAE